MFKTKAKEKSIVMKVFSNQNSLLHEKFPKLLEKKDLVHRIKSNYSYRKKPVISCNIRKKNKNYEIVANFQSIAPHSIFFQKQVRKRFFQNLFSTISNKFPRVVLFFDFNGKRKRKNLWITTMPNEPLFFLRIENIKISTSLNFFGNHIKWAKPILLFDIEFDTRPHLKIIKKILQQFFCLKTKNKNILPYTDHVISLCFYNRKIWFRNFQINFSKNKKSSTYRAVDQLIETGPRMTLLPVRGWSDFTQNQLIYDSTIF